jgi:hypothetical protein
MNPIEWPGAPPQKRTESPNLVPLPELELDDSDYEAAAEALRNLEGCFSEVVFVHEVAARHCRERQLRTALMRSNSVIPDPARAKAFIDQWKKPTPLSQLNSYEDWFPNPIRPKRRS